MTALYRMGRQADALETFRRARHRSLRSSASNPAHDYASSSPSFSARMSEIRAWAERILAITPTDDEDQIGYWLACATYGYK